MVDWLITRFRVSEECVTRLYRVVTWYCLLSAAVCRMLSAVCCLLSAVCCLLAGVCSLLPALQGSIGRRRGIRTFTITTTTTIIIVTA
jgi:hypothetical protein